LNILPVLDISASGLSAERLRMDVIANNVANANATRGPDGLPYRRKHVVFAPRTAMGGNSNIGIGFMGTALFSGSVVRLGEGVKVTGIFDDPRPFRKTYEPGHPDADADGFVLYPNFNIAEEMVNMITASRAYEANLAVIQTAKSMALQSLAMLQG